MTASAINRIFSRIPTLQTGRLILRRLIPSDYRDMFAYASLPEVTEYLLWEPHTSDSQTYEYLEDIQRSYRDGSFSDWAVEYRPEGRMIGTCGFTEIDAGHRRAEIGYVLNPSYRNMGIATEAVRAAMEFAFSELQMNRVEAHYMEGNDASRRVMEKCGMLFEGMLRQYMYVKGEYKNIGICAITKDRYVPNSCYTRPNPLLRLIGRK